MKYKNIYPDGTEVGPDNFEGFHFDENGRLIVGPNFQPFIIIEDESVDDCPHADPFHDHGDGCPSCDVNICTTCHTVHSESKCPTCEENKS